MFTLIAHRGASDDAPENTIEAFDLAVKQGFFHVETDCQLSADGVCVILHDERLDRLTAMASSGWTRGYAFFFAYMKTTHKNTCFTVYTRPTLANLQDCMVPVHPRVNVQGVTRTTTWTSQTALSGYPVNVILKK
jgi:glycerophosphoryl diester phosphodiesterase